MDNAICPTGVWSQVVAIPDEQWGALEREIKVSFSTDARASIEAAMTEFLRLNPLILLQVVAHTFFQRIIHDALLWVQGWWGCGNLRLRAW